MKRIAVFGAGGFGKEVAMLIEQINASAPAWQLIGFFDDGVAKNAIVNGYPSLGGVAEVNKLEETTGLLLAIGDPGIKMRIHAQISNPKVYYPVLVHPNVLMGNSQYLDIGEGSIITAGNLLTVNIRLGRHVILNLACTVGHDAILEDYTSVMPGVNISGGVKIGKGVYIGTGAKLINHTEVGSHTIIGAGAVVVKSLPAHCTAVGVPARPIKFHA
ncbi:acetyltransferase [Pontibacter sp. E15-1]|uniref:acetyltransferase n=1 Tax=Pontibacter sp. E15-1 TaxID=2919918 RepID=UPI001F4F892D|nr:acetyltransferase [Pontibacter sp. E15-1]MCJ8164444.1 acetyltransferase [Pontibacter sp. E15-1]